jgi:hypothetical protein
MLRMFQRLSVAILCLALMPALARGADETADQATWLLKKATLIHQNAFQNVLLRALRQMRDPQLDPLFSDLVQRRHPAMKIHGILGLAEISPNRRIDLALLADIEDRGTQALLVSAAMDADLFTLDDARQLIAWPGLDTEVKVLVAAQLISEGQTVDQAVLDEAMDRDNLALRSMAALLALQAGNDEAMTILQELNTTQSPRRDGVRAMIIQTAIRYEFDRLAPWALQIVDEPEVDEALAYQALRAAMQFGAEGAVERWMHRYDAATGEADRIRLSVLALDLADQLDPRVFEPLQRDSSQFIQLVGQAGAALASGQPATNHIIALIDQNNVLASRWALHRASELEAEQSAPLLEAMILASASGPDRFRAQRLEHAVMAAQELFEKGGNEDRLRELLGKVPALTCEAMLMGLIRSSHGDPSRIIEPIEDWPSKTAESMALLLKLKHMDPQQTLASEQLRRLSLMVRGGGGVEDPLRIQAAWVYLKRTNQDRIALATVLGR